MSTRYGDSTTLADLRAAAARAHAGIDAGALGADSAHAAVEEMVGAGEELEQAAERASSMMDDLTTWLDS